MSRSFEQNLVEHCAPTLAGLKSANLFHVRTQDAAALHQSVAQWHEVLQARGLTLTVLKECPKTNSFLVYLYRATKLQEELQQPEVQAFLQQEGYAASNADTNACLPYLQQLSERLCTQESFPHEIGLFLG